MSLSNKELLDKIKDQVAIDANGWREWDHVPLIDQNRLWPIVCERYATEKAKELFTRSEVESCIKDSLQEAAENLKFTLFPGGEQFVYPHVISHSDLGQQVIVDKSSITDTKNIKIK